MTQMQRDGYPDRKRTSGTFTLTGLENADTHDGNIRRVYHVRGDSLLLVVWGTEGGERAHVDALDALGPTAFPFVIECEWIEPSDWATKPPRRHGYWVWQTDRFRICAQA